MRGQLCVTGRLENVNTCAQRNGQPNRCISGRWVCTVHALKNGETELATDKMNATITHAQSMPTPTVRISKWTSAKAIAIALVPIYSPLSILDALVPACINDKNTCGREVESKRISGRITSTSTMTTTTATTMRTRPNGMEYFVWNWFFGFRLSVRRSRAHLCSHFSRCQPFVTRHCGHFNGIDLHRTKLFPRYRPAAPLLTSTTHSAAHSPHTHEHSHFYLSFIFRFSEFAATQYAFEVCVCVCICILRFSKSTSKSFYFAICDCPKIHCILGRALAADTHPSLFTIYLHTHTPLITLTNRVLSRARMTDAVMFRKY